MKRVYRTRQTTSLPRATNTGQFNSNNWLGFDWSATAPLSDISPPSESGIYKIARRNELLYCGQSINLKDRISSHKRNQLFGSASIAFFTMPGAQLNHLKEREVDMIGAYYDALSKCPVYQYSKNRKNESQQNAAADTNKSRR
jgi:hypothetical protein